MGIFLSTNSYSENRPLPITIDFEVSDEMPSSRAVCDNCNINYDATLMGASCCDEAISFVPSLTCEILESAYFWNCSGCDCSDWDNGYNDYGNGSWDTGETFNDSNISQVKEGTK